jgi:putative endonuclease
MSKRRRAYRAGLLGEAACVWWLRLRGYRILARRYRAPVGEIDIVARRGRLLAMVEVKTRAAFAEALEAVGPRQRQRVERAAEAFLARHPDLADAEVRFDVMLVVPWRPPRHIMDAWRP